MTDNKTSRRAFLRNGLMAGAAGVASTMALPVEAKTDKPKFDRIVDVIVVGSGFAGLSAALEARLSGLEVLLLEKMAVIGGNAAINGGAFGVAGSPRQE